MSNKENLIGYLLRNGKDLSWDELARGFGYPNADAARMAWSNYRRDNPDTPTYISQPAKINSVSPFVAARTKTVQAKEQYTMDLEDKITRFEEDLTKGTAQVEATVRQEIKTLDELIEKCKIDTTKWEITKYVQNFWNNRYQVKAFLAPKQEKNVFQENFIEFLKGYTPKGLPILVSTVKELDAAMDEVFISQHGEIVDPNDKGCLIINKQDYHYNKLDIDGNNDITRRFLSVKEAISRVVRKSELSYRIEKIVYVIGSDEFNSEWTEMTTKGTPQSNIMEYHTAFAALCDHEVEVIKMLAKAGRIVSVVYMPGNHDEYVGWHMITWLATYFRSNAGIEFDVSPSYRKYMKFGNSAMMFNHGDIVKPEKLASVFPQEFKLLWSECDYQYIFTGDKHNEKTTDFGGIMHYQLTQGSNATSKWDSKHGYKARGFLTAFVISERWGMADTYHERL